jgi:hypothetical protein
MPKNEESSLDVVFKMAMIAGPVLLYLLIFILIDRVDRIATATEKLQVAPTLPAGIYICDGDRCVIANDENLYEDPR